MKPLALLLLLPLTAQAASLRPYMALDAGTVRLSDLFEGADDRPLGPAPEPGHRITVEAPQLTAIAHMFGVDWRPSGPGDRAVLERPGRQRHPGGCAAPTPNPVARGWRPARQRHRSSYTHHCPIPANATLSLDFMGTSFDAASGRFTTLLQVAVPTMPTQTIRLSGRVQAMVELPVARRAMLPGETMHADDLQWTRMRLGLARGELVRQPAQVEGQALRHSIQAGQPLALADLGRPIVVAKGTPLTLTLEGPGIALTAQAVAAEPGGIGDHIHVTNPYSRAVIEAEITGPGRAPRHSGDLVRAGGEPMRHIPLSAGLVLLLALPACGTLSKLAEVGRPPSMTPSGDPTADPAYRPISLPMPRPQTTPAEANSLWRNGSRAFFKDQRAAAVGDILTVLVNISDAANLQNASTGGRQGTQTAGAPSLLGLQASIPHLFSQTTPDKLLSTSSNGTSTGTGTIKRQENVTLRLAGVITQVLPNGNLALAARQEVRVNSELRDLQVSGVVRPQDIGSDNTVQHDRLAEARIAYADVARSATCRRRATVNRSSISSCRSEARAYQAADSRPFPACSIATRSRGRSQAGAHVDLLWNGRRRRDGAEGWPSVGGIRLQRGLLRPDMIGLLLGRDRLREGLQPLGDHLGVPGVPFTDQPVIDVAVAFPQVGPFHRVRDHVEKEGVRPDLQHLPITVPHGPLLVRLEAPEQLSRHRPGTLDHLRQQVHSSVGEPGSKARRLRPERWASSPC